MASNDELQRVDATAAELQRWWQDAVIQRSSAIVRAERAEAELAALRVPCMWTYSDKAECYEAPCGNKDEYRRRFCGTCGHPVQVAE